MDICIAHVQPVRKQCIDGVVRLSALLNEEGEAASHERRITDGRKESEGGGAAVIDGEIMQVEPGKSGCKVLMLQAQGTTGFSLNLCGKAGTG